MTYRWYDAWTYGPTLSELSPTSLPRKVGKDTNQVTFLGLRTLGNQHYLSLAASPQFPGSDSSVDKGQLLTTDILNAFYTQEFQREKPGYPSARQKESPLHL